MPCNLDQLLELPAQSPWVTEVQQTSTALLPQKSLAGIDVSEDAVNLYYYLKAKSTVSMHSLCCGEHAAICSAQSDARGCLCERQCARVVVLLQLSS